MAVDAKYGRIFLEEEVQAMLEEVDAGAQLNQVLEFLRERVYDFHFGLDEPVVVFRAQDKLLPKLLAYYHLFCLKAGSPRHHLDLILDSRDKVLTWQDSHRTKVPSSDALASKG